MTRELGSSGSKIKILAPSWFDQVFGSGGVGRLLVDGALQSDLMRAVDANPLTYGFGVQIGVIGRADGMEQPVRANHIIRGPLGFRDIMLTLIIGPELSKPPTAPEASKTHQIISELFSTTLTCGLAVAGWIGAIGTAAAAGATGGASLVATVYFSSAASMSTVQCVGGLVHSGLILSGAEDKAKAMEHNEGWKVVDRTADFFNLLSLVYVGRDAIQVARALERTGVKLSNATAGELSKSQALTMGELMRMAPEIRNPEEVATDIRTRIMNTALLGLGIYNSSRDSSGGYAAVKELVVGDAKAQPAPAPTGSPVAAAAVAPVVQAGLPGPASSSFVAPRIVDQMLNYKDQEIATISVCLLKKNF